MMDYCYNQKPFNSSVQTLEAALDVRPHFRDIGIIQMWFSTHNFPCSDQTLPQGNGCPSDLVVLDYLIQ